jgi:predicted nucleotidyltransferase
MDLWRAAKYSEEVLRYVDAGEINVSHLIQNEESFVEQLEQKYPDVLKNLGKTKVRDALVRKARKRVISRARSLLYNIVPVIARATSGEERDYAAQLLTEFIEKEGMPPEDVLSKFEAKFPLAKRDILELSEEIDKSAQALTNLLKQLDPQHLNAFPQMRESIRKSLDDLKRVMSAKMRQIPQDS